MAVERYCTEKGCPGGDGCTNMFRSPDGCAFEYVAANSKPEYRWPGDGAPPRRWFAADGTMVYRSYADYCD